MQEWGFGTDYCINKNLAYDNEVSYMGTSVGGATLIMEKDSLQ